MDQSAIAAVLLDSHMAKYRVHFVNHGNIVWRVEQFIAPNDNAARVHASQHYRSSGVGMGYEIWKDDQLIHTEVYR